MTEDIHAARFLTALWTFSWRHAASPLKERAAEGRCRLKVMTISALPFLSRTRYARRKPVDAMLAACHE